MAPAVILYDGVCGFCDRTVRFVLQRDPDARFRFAPLQRVRRGRPWPVTAATRRT